MDTEYYLAVLDQLHAQLKADNAAPENKRWEDRGKAALDLVTKLAVYKEECPGISVTLSSLKSAVSQFYDVDADLGYQWASREIRKLRDSPLLDDKSKESPHPSGPDQKR